MSRGGKLFFHFDSIAHLMTEYEIMNELKTQLTELIDISELSNIEQQYKDGRSASKVRPGCAMVV